jgi:hypothetical protein
MEIQKKGKINRVKKSKISNMEMSRSDVCGRQGFWTKVSTVDSEVEWKWRTVEGRERGRERKKETNKQWK